MGAYNRPSTTVSEVLKYVATLSDRTWAIYGVCPDSVAPNFRCLSFLHTLARIWVTNA